MANTFGHVHANGKWLAQNMTGTQRYAQEMIRAIAADGRLRVTLHVPKNAPPAPFGDSTIEVRRAPVSGVLFEQVYLPIRTAGKMLLNFAGPAPLLKRRQLVTMHDATPFRYPATFTKQFVLFYFVMYSLLARLSHHLVTVSHFSAGELAEVFRVPARKFIVAGCAADNMTEVDEQRPDIAGLPDEFYLAVGRLAVHKNLTGPVGAVAKSGRVVVVVGAAGAQQAFSAADSLTGDAIVPGHLSDAELVWLYRHARGLIFPSKYEGFGMPPLEAQSLGCPVISSAAASLPEVCGDGALYFDPDDTTALIANLQRLEEEPELVAALRETGKANCDRYSWTASSRRVVDALVAAARR